MGIALMLVWLIPNHLAVHQMQNLLAHNLPSHLPHRCGTLVYREKPNSSKRQELQTALTPYLESHEVQLSGCLVRSFCLPLRAKRE